MRYSKTTFDDYICKIPKQQEVKDLAVRAAAERLNIIMVGGFGTGKTMLANCITNSIAGSYVVTASAIARAFRDAIKLNEPETPIFDKLANPDYMIIDEIGAYKLSEHEYKIINEVIDIRYREMKPTGVISNLNLGDLRELIGGRVIDRLKDDGGLLACFDWDSERG